ncbi:hypothetical protein C5C05_04425 [Clavibacter michiganensis]|uniref:hypothetical protein n=1 Tax=Clavibacter michiganensis TaxID=28447 RepID=UPI000CE7B23E|nr:hypothetical protein [Clavibacter michiganensis]PPF97943.1 hypothetical protein C5C05_04425 [Clavibacter michiganensis]
MTSSGGGTGRMIVNPGPWDNPPRKWVAGDEDGEINLSIIVDGLGARESLIRLHRGEPLDDHDLALFGIVNFQAFLMTYEPVVALLREPRRPQLHPAVIELMPVLGDGPASP